MTHALYPISGDPPSLGHADILHRASQAFSQVTWALAVHPKKRYLFSLEERMKMLDMYIKALGVKNVQTHSYQGSTLRQAEKIGAKVIIKGLRNSQDMLSEQEQAFGNHCMNPNIHTLCLFTQPKYSQISSSLIRELIGLEEGLANYLAPEVEKFVHILLQSRK